jgi:hypothetical protein
MRADCCTSTHSRLSALVPEVNSAFHVKNISRRELSGEIVVFTYKNPATGLNGRTPFPLASRPENDRQLFIGIRKNKLT